MTEISSAKRHVYRLPLEHKEFEVVVTADDCLELYVDDCLRKSCAPVVSSDQLYVWTNIELLWEEHKYVEARFSILTRQLKVTVNRETVLETNCD